MLFPWKIRYEITQIFLHSLQIKNLTIKKKKQEKERSNPLCPPEYVRNPTMFAV